MPTTDFSPFDKVLAAMRFSHVKPFVKPGINVLDIGCGSDAKFLKTIEAQVARADGYDLGLTDQVIDEHFALHQLDYDYAVLAKNKHHYDLITLLAVFEHIPLEVVDQLLIALRAKLEPDGLLFMTTPTVPGKYVLEFISYRLKLISPVQIRDHKKYYMRPDFEDFCQRLGFELVDYHTFQFGLNSVIVLKKAPLPAAKKVSSKSTTTPKKSKRSAKSRPTSASTKKMSSTKTT